MKTKLRKRLFFILLMILIASLAFTSLGCDEGQTPSGCDTGGSNSSSGGSQSETNIALSASVSTSYVSAWETLSAVNDDSNPAGSNDNSGGAYGNWDNPNSLQWVQYDWNQNYTISKIEVYWYDDNGGVLTPTTAYVEYYNGSNWVRCGDVPKVKDAWNSITVNNITTYRLRLSMQNASQSTGVLEWRVWGVPAGGTVPTPTPDDDPAPDPSVPDVFEAVNTGPGGSSYTDSARFRVYTQGGNADLALAHLEAAYKCFITDWGFRSTGLSVFNTENDGPYYKMNVYPMNINAGGYMGYDNGKGLAYIQVLSSLITDPKVFVHEYGHAINLHQIKWMDQSNTGAWWETFANWVADTYINSSYYEDVRKRYGLGDGGTIIDLNRNINMSYLTIVHDQNYYQAWPFFTYLTNNPDNYPGLGKMTLVNMNSRYKSGSNETPLHALERLSSVSVQTILGRYWARMAYLDIGHPKAQQVFFNTRNSLDFNNLESYGSQTYRVKAARQPMYGGANIIPLRVTDGSVSVQVTNLGNGRADSNFTATLSIRAGSGSVRYVDLPNGSGQATVGSSEEASLVVVNTPNNLIMYDAFNSGSSSPERIGLNYQVRITGATPTN